LLPFGALRNRGEYQQSKKAQARLIERHLQVEREIFLQTFKVKIR
jgi:hypothetical protein